LVLAAAGLAGFAGSAKTGWMLLTTV